MIEPWPDLLAKLEALKAKIAEQEAQGCFSEEGVLAPADALIVNFKAEIEQIEQAVRKALQTLRR